MSCEPSGSVTQVVRAWPPGAQLIRLDHGAMVDPTGALKNPPPALGKAGFDA